MGFIALATINAQTADEIVASYLETIGGVEQLSALKSTKMKGTAKVQGMEIPVSMTSAEGGKTRMDMVFQGKEITQMAFDGETGWSTNFMTMEAEKWDSEQSLVMKHQTDFPDEFLGYKEKGYTVTLEGEEEIEGTPCFKVVITKTPIEIDGKEEVNMSEYYFDKDSYVPIMSRSYELTGEMKGKSAETYYSDYDEVDGYIFPFTITQKFEGQQVFSVTMEEVLLNEELETSVFAYPEPAAAKE